MFVHLPARMSLAYPMAIWLTISTLVASTTAQAQPGRSPGPIQPQPAPPTNYPGGPSYVSPYAYGANYHLLTAHERELLLQGEISIGQTIGGGALSLWLGFGIGHAVQGRYASVGWKFTLGELAAIAGVFVGASMAIEDGYNNSRRGASGGDVLIISAIGYGILRVWDAIDAFVGPGLHNQQVRAARWKAGGTPYYGFFVAPSQDQNGGVAGLRLHF